MVSMYSFSERKIVFNYPRFWITCQDKVETLVFVLRKDSVRRSVGGLEADFQYCNIAVLHFNIAILFLDFCNIALLFKNVVLQYCNIAKSQEVLKCNTSKNDIVFWYFQM